MSRPIQFYVTIDRCVSIANFDVIPFLLMMKWHNQRAAKEMHLKVVHPETAEPRALMRSTFFHSISWDDVDNVVDTRLMARLRLRGKNSDGTDDIFALMGFDRNAKGRGGCIVFSPLPFGIDCKVRLPYRGEDREMFLRAASIVLRSLEGIFWHDKNLRDALGVGADLHEAEKVLLILHEMERLQLVEWRGHWSPAMTASRFEEIFDAKLP